MRRSWEVIEDILKIAEKMEGHEISQEDYLPESLNRQLGEDREYEALLKYNLGLLKTEKYIGPSNYAGGIGRLSWRGHNLLEDLRRETYPQAARS